MEWSLPVSVVAIFNTEPTFGNEDIDHLDLLESLWKRLKSIYADQKGPYPANHGEKHINIVLTNLAYLLDSFKLPSWGKFEIIAAGMIHDIGMFKMLPDGSDSEMGNHHRRGHAALSTIEYAARPELEAICARNGQQIKDSTLRRIVKIASGHAGDQDYTPKQKQDNVLKSGDFHAQHLIRGMRTLRLADFLDLGRDRLVETWQGHDWTENQLRHVKQHLSLVMETVAQSRCIELRPAQTTSLHFELGSEENRRKIEVSPLEISALLRMVHEDLRPIFDDFNYYALDEKKWQIKPLDEKEFGQVWPLSSGVGLFSRVLHEQQDKSMSEFAMPMDLMGHSLYGRFVQDHEKLNVELKKLLRDGNLKMRVLLLDPHAENQQMCEVFEAQQEASGERRSILPLYNAENLLDQGDILQTLSVLSHDWVGEVGARSSLEVRLTNRVMYMSLTRYGDAVVTTPYSSKGLFNSSIGLLYGKESTLTQAYINEFESIWDSPATRLYLHVDHTPGNPVRRLVSCSANELAVPALNYEKYFLTHYLDRIISVFAFINDTSLHIPPPVEIEIQPSAECNLKCRHCVGRYLSQGNDIKQRPLDRELWSKVAEALSWVSGGYSVDRFRVSGLLGDPLSDAAAVEFTLSFLEKARKANKHTVLFTNGLGLVDINGHLEIEQLLSANDIHVSLDAATSETFSLGKGAPAEEFDKIIDTIRHLCRRATTQQHLTNFGLGFVVNEANAFEVVEAIKLASKIDARFIRFKPDIRGSRGIPWRVWREAERKILNYQIGDSLDVILTNVAWPQSRLPSADRCWAQYLFASVAPTGKVHVCDHLTESNDEACIGSLREKNIDELWKDALMDGKLGKKSPQCKLCPPLNWHMNRLIDQLFVLYKQYGKDRLKGWVNDALSARSGKS